MAKYQFGNFEVEFDPTNVEFVKKYEMAAENYKNKVQNMPSNKKASETMEYLCCVFFETFDAIFGADTSKQMFGDVLSVDLCIKAFQALVKIMNDYSKLFKEFPATHQKPKNKGKKTL